MLLFITLKACFCNCDTIKINFALNPFLQWPFGIHKLLNWMREQHRVCIFMKIHWRNYLISLKFFMSLVETFKAFFCSSDALNVKLTFFWEVLWIRTLLNWMRTAALRVYIHTNSLENLYIMLTESYFTFMILNITF